MIDKCAVLVRGAYKQYGRKSVATTVLDNLDMTVTKGTIYGLLGASGCGKTTLLSCVVGTRSLDAGDILVMGENPSVITNWNTAYKIGYMPQENALVLEFNVKESVYYFGWLYGMKGKDLDDSYSVLSDLLQLPPDKQLIRNLSGGQLRRVSLATTLIHSPELLILDEPTVGLDPLLRQGTWNHLFNLAKQGTTIIITTHYIEEARQADRIGLMRNGRLLAEDSPDRLISDCQCSSLEEVFLLLSSGKRLRPKLLSTDDFNHSQKNMSQENSDDLTKKHFNTSTEILIQDVQSDPISTPVVKFSSKRSPHWLTHKISVMKTLLYKNSIKTFRHKGAVFFVFLFPFLQLSSFFLAVGHIPQGLKVAVINEELGNYSDCDEMLRYQPMNITVVDSDECYFSDLSCLFLDSIDDSFTQKVFYSDINDAIYELSRGNVIAAIHFSQNFTTALKDRIEAQNYIDEDTVSKSEIEVFVDETDKQLADILRLKYFDAFTNFSQTIVTSCERPEKLAHIPMDFKTPIYGGKYMTYTDFMLSGMLISIIYFLSASLSSAYIIMERNEQIWDRSLVAGVSEIEMFFSYLTTHSIQMAFQIAILFLVTFLLFNVPVPEQIGLVIMMVTLQGFAGLTFGFMISAMFDDVRTSNYITMGLFVPYSFLSGFIWPVQGMPLILRYMSYLTPGTLSIEGLRAVMFKNWDIKHLQVALGFLTPGIWIVLQIVLCIFFMKHK